MSRVYHFVQNYYFSMVHWYWKYME